MCGVYDPARAVAAFEVTLCEAVKGLALFLWCTDGSGNCTELRLEFIS